MRFVVLLLLLPILAACASVIDADQARVCRTVVPALHPEGTLFDERALMPAGDGPAAMRLTYNAREPGDINRPHWLTCRFAGTTGMSRNELVGITADGQPMGDTQLYILRRWWLADPAAASLPETRPAFRVSPGVAYALQQGINGMALAAIYGLLATSFALLYGLIGRINLAFGEAAVAAGACVLSVAGIAASFGRLNAGSLVVALICGVAYGALLVWTLGSVVLDPLHARSRSPLPILIATIAAAIVMAEGLRLTLPFRDNWLPPLLNSPLAIAESGPFVVTTTRAQALATLLGLGGAFSTLLIMSRTSFGRRWRAFADDAKMAELLGISASRLLGGTYILSGALAGLAGSLVVLAYGTIEPGAGLSIGLKALIAAIIGGIGSVPGAFIGGLLVGGIETLWSATFDIVYRDVVIYLLLAATLVLRPGGLLGWSGGGPRDI